MTIEYDGSRYDGWQRMGKDSTDNTIERKLVEVLQKMTGEDVEIFCGHRTEKGVHAYAQVANFKLNSAHKASDIKNYLNRYLPRDISVLELEDAEERFHAQLNAKSRTYVYRIDTKDVANVFERKYMYHVFKKLDVEAMQQAAKVLVGEHDFKNFTTARKSKSTIKVINKIDIYDDGSEAEIRINGNDFLHNMVRFIIGMLIDIGTGKRPVTDMEAVLNGKDGVEISAPADVCGLFLESVRY